MFIDDLVTYEGETLKDLEGAFHEMVDDYLVTCQELGKKPQKSYSGSFNVRPGMEIHQVLAETAQYNDVSLNRLITYIFTQFIQCNLNGNKKLNILSKI